MGKMTLGPNLTPFIRINFRKIREANVKIKLKSFSNIIREYLYDLWEKIFLKKDTKTLTI